MIKKLDKQLLTKIKNSKGEVAIVHPLFPSHALEIALREGLPVKTSIVKKITSQLNSHLENSYFRWSDDYPVDYDCTIIARNVMDFLGHKQSVDLDLYLNEKGLVYTFFGGTKAKKNNSVDLLINARILEYLLRTNNEQYAQRIKDSLFKNKNKFILDIKDISKYYLSNGYLAYVVSKISKDLDINMQDYLEKKIHKATNRTDQNFFMLASQNIKLYQCVSEDTRSLDLFWHPRLKSLFSCQFFDEIVQKCADMKLKQDVVFDSLTAEIYNKLSNKLYDYKTQTKHLNELFDELNISKEDKLAELAIGTGNLLEKIAKKGYAVTGIDSSDSMLNFAKEKVKTFRNVQVYNQNVEDFHLSNSFDAIYTANFIDLYREGVQFWTNTEEKAEQILYSINKSLKEGSYFFLSKKQEKKKSEEFELSLENTYKGNEIINTYLYQDSDWTFRRSYNKIGVSFDNFSRFVKDLGWEKTKENDGWIAYQKNKK